ncbi:uncharacterized protein LDX57_003043 [Aspergillus melleus]|uniref:uncharacterized protein n=1 Tax=Aspergillus melleus TaxID=138277 RepID=UPI001E8CFFBF|nr:uncharacterized protein LDX57_003043 [Aspergillus melleus]KAH8425285.1 hypothetical protein LDX57_003043 [Aspergillus melleus]
MYKVSHLPRWWLWYVFIALPETAKSFEEEVRQALSILSHSHLKLRGWGQFVYEDLKSIPTERNGPYGLIVKVYIHPGTCTHGDRKGRKRVEYQALKTLESLLDDDPPQRLLVNVDHNYDFSD